MLYWCFKVNFFYWSFSNPLQYFTNFTNYSCMIIDQFIPLRKMYTICFVVHLYNGQCIKLVPDLAVVQRVHCTGASKPRLYYGPQVEVLNFLTFYYKIYKLYYFKMLLTNDNHSFWTVWIFDNTIYHCYWWFYIFICIHINYI